jgi:hypothetical protein
MMAATKMTTAGDSIDRAKLIAIPHIIKRRVAAANGLRNGVAGVATDDKLADINASRSVQGASTRGDFREK